MGEGIEHTLGLQELHVQNGVDRACRRGWESPKRGWRHTRGIQPDLLCENQEQWRAKRSTSLPIRAILHPSLRGFSFPPLPLPTSPLRVPILERESISVEDVYILNQRADEVDDKENDHLKVSKEIDELRFVGIERQQPAKPLNFVMSPVPSS